MELKREPNLKVTPLYELHKSLGAKMVEFAGYSMPVQYTSIIEEHLAVRNSAGIFDVSHMARFEVSGDGAGDFLEWLVTNRIAKLREGRATYSPMCNYSGGILDDLVIYSITRGKKYLIVANAANHEKDLAWITDRLSEFNARNNLNLQIRDVTQEMAQIALQGPDSQRYLSKRLGVDLSDLYFYQFKWVGNLLLSRTGYTGEDGFEVYGPPEELKKIFEDLLSDGVKPAGLGARDTLRLEAGYPLYGNELDESVNPFEAGIGWTVKMDKDFIGREAIAEKRPEWRTVGLTSEGRGIPRKGYRVLSPSKEEIGVITSGTLSPSLKRPIAISRVRASYDSEQVLVDIRGRELSFKVVDLPFVPHRVRRKPRKKA